MIRFSSAVHRGGNPPGFLHAFLVFFAILAIRANLLPLLVHPLPMVVMVGKMGPQRQRCVVVCAILGPDA